MESDYIRKSYIGFVMALWSLPSVMAKKDDLEADHTDLKGDLNDADDLGRILEAARSRARRTMEGEPHIGRMIRGNFRERKERGRFK